jgi:hypothetical protein
MRGYWNKPFTPWDGFKLIPLGFVGLAVVMVALPVGAGLLAREKWRAWRDDDGWTDRHGTS